MVFSYQPYFLWRKEMQFTSWWATRERTPVQGWVCWKGQLTGVLFCWDRVSQGKGGKESYLGFKNKNIPACWIHTFGKLPSVSRICLAFLLCREIPSPRRFAWESHQWLKTTLKEKLVRNGLGEEVEEGGPHTSLRWRNLCYLNIVIFVSLCDNLCRISSVTLVRLYNSCM